MYLDNTIIFTKNEKEVEILIQTMRIHSQVIGMEFGIEKRAMLIMKKRKRKTAERIKVPNQERVRRLGEKEKFQGSGIIGSGHCQAEM